MIMISYCKDNTPCFSSVLDSSESFLQLRGKESEKDEGQTHHSFIIYFFFCSVSVKETVKAPGLQLFTFLF